MAQLVSEDLQLVGREAVVVPQHVVMRGSAGALETRGDGFERSSEELRKTPLAEENKHDCTHLNTGMTAQVEVKLKRVCDAGVDRGSGWNVATFPNLEGKESETRVFIDTCSSMETLRHAW